MRLTTWNCARGFEKKKPQIFKAVPDIAVIQECSKKSTESLPFEGYQATWVGTNPNIGMGVFYKNGWTVRRLDETETGIEWVVPFAVTGPENFTLIAVWACEVKGNKRDSYVGQLGRALHKHSKWFRRGPVVMMGDFNSNACFDKARPDWNHTKMVKALSDLGLESAYHVLTTKAHGNEDTPTFYLYKKKPFHFDYVFAPKDWRSRMSVTVGTYPTWKPYSDHCPVTIEVAANA